jgi:hypothetical protein
VALVAMGCGWWLDRSKQADEAALWRDRAEFIAGGISFQGGPVVFEKWKGREAVIDYRYDGS